MAGYVARVRERRGVYRIFVGNADGTRPLGCPSIGERVKLNWIFKKWAEETMDWIDLAQDKDSWRVVVNAVMKLRFP